MQGLLFRVEDLGYRVGGLRSQDSGLEFMVRGLLFRVECLGYMVGGLRSQDSGLEFMVRGLLFRVECLGYMVGGLRSQDSGLEFMVQGLRGSGVKGLRFKFEGSGCRATRVWMWRKECRIWGLGFRV
jgi:hypothetical protein